MRSTTRHTHVGGLPLLVSRGPHWCTHMVSGSTISPNTKTRYRSAPSFKRAGWGGLLGTRRRRQQRAASLPPTQRTSLFRGPPWAIKTHPFPLLCVEFKRAQRWCAADEPPASQCRGHCTAAGPLIMRPALLAWGWGANSCAQHNSVRRPLGTVVCWGMGM